MNEIRMYVERLFQGKTLTGDIIELKEEIYGNLVARYEDYLAEGMSEAEALEKTKASMTSIDDVIAGDGAGAAEASEAETVTKTVDAAPDASKPAESGNAVHAVPDADPTVVLPSAMQGTPTNPLTEEDGARHATPRAASSKKKWIIAAVIAVIVLGGIALGMAVADELADMHEDRIEAQRDRKRDAGTTGITIDNDGVSVRNGDDEVTIDSDGTIRLDGDLADELLTDVVNGSSDELRSYVDTDLSDGAAVEQAIQVLPMGRWAHAVDTTRGSGVLALSYEQLPDFDGDSIDVALVYNATALFCLIPGMDELQVSVSEADDKPNDRDYYVFSREVLEGKIGYGVALTSDMLNESNWDGQVKRDHLYKNDFVDHIIDRVEAE